MPTRYVLLGPSSISVDGNASISAVALDRFNNTASLHTGTIQVIVSHPGVGSTLVTLRNGTAVLLVRSTVLGPVQVEFATKTLPGGIDASALLTLTFVAGKWSCLSDTLCAYEIMV